MSGDGIPYKDRRRELPVLAQEDRTRPGQIHRHEGMEEARRETTLDHKSPELRTRREVLVEMQRIVVTGQLGKGRHVICGESEAATRLRARFHCVLGGLGKFVCRFT